MPNISLSNMTRVFARIGCLSFGGPAGQIALMHRELVDERQWVAEDEFLHALNFCHLLPGPEAQQLATYIGWKLHGARGGLIAGLLFVLPGAAVMLALSMLYVLAADLHWFQALFLGIKAAVLAIVVQALLRVAGKALGTRFKMMLAVLAFILIGVFALPFPLVVLGLGALGFIVAQTNPDWLGLASGQTQPDLPPRPPLANTVRSILVWGLVWALPLALVLVLLGPDHVLCDIGLFFSKLAVVTFGGAYAVLAYMAQQAVEGFQWLRPGEMADGLGLAETTPGPLIMVTQYVGFIAAFRTPDPFSPLIAGIAGAVLTTWVTFAPCFLWIFTFAPWVERLQHASRLKGALSAVTAAIVGVITNLALWFALHLLFTRSGGGQLGGLALPDLSSFDARAAAIAAIGALLIFRAHWGIMPVLAVSAALGLVASLF